MGGEEGDIGETIEEKLGEMRVGEVRRSEGRVNEK